MAEGKKHGCILYGCGTILILVAIIVAIGVGAYLYGSAALKPICDEYLELTQADKYEEAYQGLAPAWKETLSVEELAQFERDIRNGIGVLQSKTFTNVHIQSGTTGSTATVAYNAVFSKSPQCTLTFTLVKTEGIWQIVGVNYNSPEIEAGSICPKCQNAVSVLVQFCPKCGTEIQPTEESAEEK